MPASKATRQIEERIFDAMSANDVRALKALADDHGKPAVDRDGRNVLINCVIEGKTPLVRKLLEVVDVDAPDRDGMRALHFAVQERRLPLVKLLLESGAKVDVQDRHGNTPLLRGMLGGAPASIIKALLEAGANPRKANKQKVNALSVVEDTEDRALAKLFEDRRRG